jgi:hypothetical protein
MLFAGVAITMSVLIGTIWTGSRRQQRSLSLQVDRLRATATSQGVVVTAAGMQGLDAVPPPVARYLRWALGTTTHIHELRIAQVGTLRTGVHTDRWMPFDAEHIVVPPGTGFVWNARVGVGPLLHIRVRDALINGRGSGHVSLLSAFTMAAHGDTPEIDSGSLHRYLAEAVWYPTALLPSAKLRWTEIDATRAIVTLTEHDVSVSLEFRFATTGEVTGIYTPGRWGSFPDGYRRVPWQGHFRNYREWDGVIVPSEGDVAWYIDSQWQPVWKARVTSFRISKER